MLFGRENFSKKNQGKFLLGYEIGCSHVQISYKKVGEKDPQTLSVVAGAEEYNIPLVLFQSKITKLWYFGKEAVEKAKQEEGNLLSGLWDLVCSKEEIILEEEKYRTCALLALFIKRSFSLLSMIAPLDTVAACMFTMEGLNEKKIGKLRETIEYLQLPEIEFHFMGKEESFFYYNLHTEMELWKNNVYLYEMGEKHLVSYCLGLNRNTSPIVTLIEKKEYPFLKRASSITIEEREEQDGFFLTYLKEDMKDKTVSCVYLIGEGFLGEWYQKSIRFLCTKRRVFLGNNLYSKGACLGLSEWLMPSDLSKKFVYLGDDKLMANVGLLVLSREKEAYLPILDGGNSWYESKGEWDLILEKEHRLRFRITPLNGKNVVYSEILLHGLTLHPSAYCRIHMEVYMESREKMVIKIWEKGFGEFFPSSGQYWEERITI